MTKKNAIEFAREWETETLSWSGQHNMWYERPEMLSKKELKNSRIVTAIKLLDPQSDIDCVVGSDPGYFDSISFREAVYGYKQK